MNDKNLREQLDGMKRPDLNRLAKDLKVKKVRDFKKDELINHLIEHFPAEDLIKILNVPLWKRLLKQPTHIYGIITIIALICAFLFFYFSQKGDVKVHEEMEEVKKTVQRYDPLKRDELLKEKEKKIEELKTALQDECRGNSKERKEASAELEKGNPAKALALFERSIKRKSCNLAEDYYLVGNVHFTKNQPDYQQALEAYLEAARLEPGNTKYLNMVGRVYDILADYNKAIGYLEKALALDTAVHGDQHSDVAVRLNNLGSAWSSLGNYQKAIRYYEKALAIDRKTNGEEHPSVARDWNNLGHAWGSLGNYQKAIGFFEKALAIDRKTFGEGHPSVARDWNNLGSVWYSLGNYQKAIGYVEKALAIDRKTYGEGHPSVARDWNNLGSAWDSLGNYQKAIGDYEKALAIVRKAYGEEHPKVAATWNNLGSAWLNLGNYQKAVEYSKKALTIFEKMLGSQHPHTIAAKKNLAYAVKKRSEEAEKLRSEEEKKKEKK